MSAIFDSEAISATEYHAMPGISNSRLCDYIEDPRLYHWKYVSGQYKSKSESFFDFGSAVHDICLLGTEASIAIIPNDVLSKSGSKSGGAWKEFESANTGKLLLKQHEMDAVGNCVKAIMDHPVAGKLLTSPGPAEHSFSHEDPTLEILLRCRPDKIAEVGSKKIGVDLKTTGTGTRAGKFVKSVSNFRYHCQEYFYRKVLRENGIELDSFVFVAASVTEPHTVDCFTLDEEFYRLAETSVENALMSLAERMRYGNWNEESTTITKLSPPNYLKYQSEYL